LIDWLFHHRWSKGKKNQPQKLPNGDKVVFLTVGGRTSAIVPAVQKKTGPVAKDITKEDLEDTEDDLEAEKEPTSNNQANAKRGLVKKEVNSNRTNDRKTPLKNASKREPAKQEMDAETDLAAPKLDSRKRKVAQEKSDNAMAKGRVPDAKKMKTTKTVSKEIQAPLRRGRSAARK